METDQTDDEIATQLETLQRLERDDYNHTLAGVETGRMARFGAKSKAEREIQHKKAEQVFRDVLDRFLQDPAYRALYGQLGQRLSDAEQEADDVLADTWAALRNHSKKIAEMEERAARSPDGRLVFLTADGRVVDADGEELPTEIADGIIWPTDAPTAEEYFGALEQHTAVTNQLQEWQDYRNDTLGDIRNRYDDRDNPMSFDDLGDAIERIQSNAPQASSFAPTAPSDISIDNAASPNHALPTLGD